MIPSTRRTIKKNTLWSRLRRASKVWHPAFTLSGAEDGGEVGLKGGEEALLEGVGRQDNPSTSLHLVAPVSTETEAWNYSYSAGLPL